ncbi:MAG: hypothetical protein B6D58_00925 [candidate division Zixibacteria bacterium 4484_95]|nr:MAG: hypothetical protein B6D58_00925 [candidate division Zixibacteria bacterium 4484_95]
MTIDKMEKDGTGVIQKTPFAQNEDIALERPADVFILDEKISVSFLTRKILCVDLTDKHFKYALFSRTRKSVEWLRAGKLFGLTYQTSSHDRLVSEGVKKLSEELNLKDVKILLIISGFDFFLRRVKVPDLKGDDFLKAIKWECDKLIPYSVDDAYINILNIEKTEEGIYTYVVVNLKSSIDDFSFLGDKLLGVIPSPLAFSKSIPGKLMPGGVTNILIHWGDLEAVIDFVHGERFEFSNSFTMADVIIDKEMFDPAKISEKIERNLHNTLDFYSGYYPGRQLGEIVLHGPGWEVVADDLTKATGLKTRCENPYRDLITNENNLKKFWDNYRCDYLLCSGAIRLKDKNYFLPTSIKTIYKYNKLKSLSKIMSFLIASLLIMLIGLSWLEYSIMSKKLKVIRQKINEIEYSQAYSETIPLAKAVNSMVVLVSKLKQSQTWPSNLLKVFSLSVPTGVYLNSLELSEDNIDKSLIRVRVEGFYSGDIKRSDMQLARFVENLWHICGFEKEMFEKFAEKTDGLYKRSSFVLTGSIRVK